MSAPAPSPVPSAVAYLGRCIRAHGVNSRLPFRTPHLAFAQASSLKHVAEQR